VPSFVLVRPTNNFNDLDESLGGGRLYCNDNGNHCRAFLFRVIKFNAYGPAPA